MDVREKLVELLSSVSCNGNGESLGSCPDRKYGLCGEMANLSYCVIQNAANHLIAHGVTVQEWISVNDRTPTEADGTVWVCLADVFPYNEKEPYIDAKHDRRITEAFYSQFSKRWYKDGAVFPYGVVTHWMEKAQPPKGD